jgi:hypothetical protein
MKIYLSIVVFLIGFNLGCGTIPPREVHSGVGLLRNTVLDTTPQGAETRLFSLGGNVSRGAASVDTGQGRGSTNVSGVFEVRTNSKFALGIQPYYTVVDGSLDENSTLGINFYTRWKFAETNRFTFSFYPQFGYSKNHATTHGTLCVLLLCAPTDDVSHGEVEALDVGLGFINSYYFSQNSFISLVPTLYFTTVNAGYIVNNQSIFSGSRSSLNGSVLVSYGQIFNADASTDILLQLGAGVGSYDDFGTLPVATRLYPLALVGIQVGLGKTQ